MLFRSFVGDIDYIDTDVIRKLLDNGLMPVISPLSSDGSGTLLNINADTVASAIGAALGAEKLILCTGAPGILERVEDPSSVISYTDLAGLKRLRDEKRIIDGMRDGARPEQCVVHQCFGGLHFVGELLVLRQFADERENQGNVGWCGWCDREGRGGG